MSTKKKVLVLGGGIGGLTAAQELAERGFEVKVYELKKIPGGKSRSMPVPNSGVGGRYDLPGEHGFRFVPAFYRHLPDSMKRIPFGQGKTCHDNLTPTSRIELAQYGLTPIQIPSRMPQSLGDLLLVLKDMFDTNIGLQPGELEFFAERLWQVMTSCDERRLHELENQSWWDFIGAGSRSEAYKKFLAEGLSRSLVAARAEEGSARTVGQVQVHLMFGVLDVADGSTDRVLNGPTSPQLLDPWVAYVQSLGASYTTEIQVTDFKCADGRIESVGLVNLRTGEKSRESADYYISALPVEAMGPLVTDEMVNIDPSLGTMRVIDQQVRWMNGIQFFLNKDVPITHGHVLYVDSPWAITSISQAQFFTSIDLANFGDGTVKGILSVDISDWDREGTFVKEQARNLPPEDIAKEVWEELKQSLNVDGKVLLADEDKVCWFLDTDIVDGNLRRLHKTINLEPLFINQPKSWPTRPAAGTAIENLLLASDYVQTNADLACMESANEAARRSVNAILDRIGSTQDRCRIWDMGMPGILIPFRLEDQSRWNKGLPWNGSIFAGAEPERTPTFEDLRSAMAARISDLTKPVIPPKVIDRDPANITRQDDAYHLSEYQHASHLFWYVEWWYFNWVDPATGKSGMVTFAVFNGANIDLLGVASLNCAIFDEKGTGTTLLMDYHSISKFWASEKQADVELAGSTIKVIDDDTYEINATTADGSVSMGLVYKRDDQPQLLASNVHGDLPWEISSWLVYMPSAIVNGWVDVKGTRIDLKNATGYHDHDWGIWFIPGNTWAWAAFSDPANKITWDVGLHAAFQKSTAYFRYGDLRLSFPQDTFESEFSDWQHWNLLWKYPMTVTFSATDPTGQYKIVMNWKVQDNSTLWKYPLVVFEQTARFVGSLQKKDGDKWVEVVSFDVLGFSEYTSKWVGGGPT